MAGGLVPHPDGEELYFSLDYATRWRTDTATMADKEEVEAGRSDLPLTYTWAFRPDGARLFFVWGLDEGWGNVAGNVFSERGDFTDRQQHTFNADYEVYYTSLSALTSGE